MLLCDDDVVLFVLCSYCPLKMIAGTEQFSSWVHAACWLPQHAQCLSALDICIIGDSDSANLSIILHAISPEISTAE